MGATTARVHATSLEGRIVLVTGGASGIGRATAYLCARLGASLAVLDANAVAADVVARHIARQGASAIALPCDVRDEAAVKEAFARCAEQLGVPECVVASAGIEHPAPLHELVVEQWERTIAVNLTGVFLTCREAIRYARAAAARLSIVCVSSPAAFVGFGDGGAAAYSASKGGVSAFVRAAAVEYAREGIRVNAVVPGVTDTPLAWAQLAPAEVGPVRAKLADEVPLGRLAAAEEPAQAIVWLLSDAAAYVTGVQLVCDGGILAKASIHARPRSAPRG